ncbi:MAG TPA: class I SAM-dependent methyltransferase [Rhizomicrobium sp.]|jgi:predicted O-methyltransferase YrrM
MLGSLEQALRFPKRLAGALARDPAGTWEKLQDKIVQRWEYRTPVHHHQPLSDWESRLHEQLGARRPCAEAEEFRRLWPKIVADVRGKGIDVGPASFAGYNDGDTALVRAIWCLVRHLKPVHVVETGVGHGFTSRLILEALERNGGGALHSIDRPPLDPAIKARVGIAVEERLRQRWTLLAGSSRRCLPKLISRLGSVDLFVHDSLHTERNVLFELECVWPALKPGGVAVVDDIDTNAGYGSFLQRISTAASFVCEAEPVRPDPRRFNQKGLFGILVKDR